MATPAVLIARPTVVLQRRDLARQGGRTRVSLARPVRTLPTKVRLAPGREAQSSKRKGERAMRRVIGLVSAFALGLCLTTARAAETPDGTLRLSGGSVAAGVGAGLTAAGGAGAAAMKNQNGVTVELVSTVTPFWFFIAAAPAPPAAVKN